MFYTCCYVALIIMKTLIIFNDCETVKYFIVDGDYSKFNNITFNVSIESDLENECNNWLWTDQGILKHEMTDDVIIVENKQWDRVAIITWIP